MNDDFIIVQSLNARHQEIKLKWKLKRGFDMYNFKKMIIKNCFAPKVHNKISDFIFYAKKKNSSEHVSVEDLEKNLESPDNFFNPRYDNEEAFQIFKDNNIEEFYYLALFLNLNVLVRKEDKEENIEIPLKFESNEYNEVLNHISTTYKINPTFLHLFENDEELSEIDEQQDLKIYHKKGLITFTYPIKVEFKYMKQKRTLLLKRNEPLKYYDKEIKEHFHLETSDIIFRTEEKIISNEIPIHEILKEYTNEPVYIRIENTVQDIIGIYVPINKRNIKFQIKYDKSDKIEALLENIKQYFNIKNKKVFLKSKSEILNSSLSVNLIKNKTNLVLYCEDFLKFERTFEIKGEKKLIAIDPQKKIDYYINQFKNENISAESVTFSLRGEILKSDLSFANYFILPTEEIKVEIKECGDCVKVNILGIDDIPKKIIIGLSPTNKINYIKKTHDFQNIIPEEFQKSTFFYICKEGNGLILNEKETFESYGIKNNDEIIAYANNTYIFTYENNILPISGQLSFGEIQNEVQKHFMLPPKSFFIGHKGIPTEISENIHQIINGEIFDIINLHDMDFLIEYDKEYRITIKNAKQVKDLVNELIKINADIDPKKIQLFNELDKAVSNESYLFASFSEKNKNGLYKIIVKKAEPILFQTSNGMFFNMYFAPSLTIREVIKELQARDKKIEPNSVFVFRGRILDDYNSLSSIITEDDAPIIIENERPDEITITLKFIFKDDGMSTDVAMVKGALIYDVRYLASQLASIKNPNQIVLTSNDNQLDDNDELIENIEIIVNLDQGDGNTIKDENEYEKLNQTESNIYKALTTSKKIHLSEPKSDPGSKKSDDNEEDEDEDENKPDIFERGNGTFKPSKDCPDTEFIFDFVLNGEPFKLQLPKDVTVKNVKEKISERNNVLFEDITIFVGNRRLSDFNVLTELQIPKTVHYFTVKITEQAVSLNLLESVMMSPSYPSEELTINRYINPGEEKFFKVVKRICINENSFRYKVNETRTKKPFCKKVLKPIENEKIEEYHEKTLREFNYLNPIDHPSICRNFAINLDEKIRNDKGKMVDTLALYTEFLDYKLSDCLKNNLLSNTDKARISVEIAHGLRMIHMKSRLFENLNYFKIMLNRNFEAKIIGFGHSKPDKDSEIDDILIPPLISNDDSEINKLELLNEDNYDHKTDVYLFGMFLYYIFTGKTLIFNSDEKSIQFPEPTNSMQQYCIDLIKKCLTVHPAERPSIEEVLEDMKNNSYSFADDIDEIIVSSRDNELDLIESKQKI